MFIKLCTWILKSFLISSEAEILLLPFSCLSSKTNNVSVCRLYFSNFVNVFFIAVPAVITSSTIKVLPDLKVPTISPFSPCNF